MYFQRLIGIICLVSWSSVFASPLLFREFFQNGYFQGSLGSVAYTQNSNTTIDNGLAPAPADLYSAGQAGAATGFRLEAGLEHQRVAGPWLPRYQVGIAYELHTATTVNGSVSLFSLPAYNNYTYTYSLSSQSIALILRPTVYQFAHGLSAFAEAGLGMAQEKVSGYSESALSGVTPRTSPAFGSGSQVGFAGLLGLGASYRVKERWSASLSADLNLISPSVQSGNGNDDYSEQRLTTRTTTQSFWLSIGYRL